ncbi:hypothetical protein HA402_002740 [Bradysia odoriphaga]|nr:hypothetical protein HA402_002740 [Bradysia odoriphaga]
MSKSSVFQRVFQKTSIPKAQKIRENNTKNIGGYEHPRIYGIGEHLDEMECFVVAFGEISREFPNFTVRRLVCIVKKSVSSVSFDFFIVCEWFFAVKVVEKLFVLRQPTDISKDEIQNMVLLAKVEMKTISQSKRMADHYYKLLVDGEAYHNNLMVSRNEIQSLPEFERAHEQIRQELKRLHDEFCQKEKMAKLRYNENVNKIHAAFKKYGEHGEPQLEFGKHFRAV